MLTHDTRKARRPRLRLRLRTWLHSHSIDRELANGCEPGASEERALRARQLAGPSGRRRLARSLRRIVAEAEHPGLERYSAMALNRAAVLPWRQGLLGLADRLERQLAMNPCGLARVSSLIADSKGPLYSATPERRLGEFIWWIADGLSVCSLHVWDSPVRMKVDPERVAWTCRRCGAIATSDDPRVRPA